MSLLCAGVSTLASLRLASSQTVRMIRSEKEEDDASSMASSSSSSSMDNNEMMDVDLHAEDEPQSADAKAVHEAPTLPIGHNKKREEEGEEVASPPLVIAALQRFCRSLMSDPRDVSDRALGLLSLPLLSLLFWLTCWATFGSEVAGPWASPLFVLLLLLLLALLAGKVCGLCLPPLLGMLLTGLVLRNSFLAFPPDHVWATWSTLVRGAALVVILMRAGLGLDPEALRRLSSQVFLLAFTPCLVETLVVGVASHLLLGFPWLWSFMLGFVLAAVSPAVVVPCLLQLQEMGLGVAQGIPTLVIASASIDDVLAISGFSILLGVAFKPSSDIVAIVFQGPLEVLLGLLFGFISGVLLTFVPSKSASPHVATLRFLLLILIGLLAFFGSKAVNLAGAGPLAVLVASFVAGMGWKRVDEDSEEELVMDVNKNLGVLWFFFQPILFGLIGTEIKLNRVDPGTIGLGCLVIIIGLSVRLVVSFLAVSGGQGLLNVKERLFVSLAWLPKATVQAAIGPVAYDLALENGNPEYKKMGLEILTIAVLVILITAPLGSIAIMKSAPIFLSRETKAEPTTGQDAMPAPEDVSV